jgi:hypothetical protein
MLINLTLNNNTKKSVDLIQNNFTWTYEDIDNSIKIIITENEHGSVLSIDKSINITMENEDLIVEFKNAKDKIFENESVGLESDDDYEKENEIHPYNPDLIRIEPKPFQISLVQELIEDGDIDLAPEFQRHFVWRDKGMRSRLIESIMLRIPLPLFYLSQDKDSTYQVIDGLQRLTVINQFLKNEFALVDLEYLKECDGLYFTKLNSKKESLSDNSHSKYAKRIRQTQVIFNIIDPQTPSKVKFDIFKRINQGGKPLKPQEIRNCMAKPRSRVFLQELTKSKEFKMATNNSLNPIRMEDEEIVLRFIAFYLKKENEKVSYMNTFLDETIDKINSLNQKKLDDIKMSFFNAMNNAYYLFGKFAFRKCLTKDFEKDARKPLINKSIFTTYSFVLSKYDFDTVKNSNEKDMFSRYLAKKIENNSAYLESITGGTNSFNRLQTSFKYAQELINENLIYKEDS